jgi:hypothetical protein
MGTVATIPQVDDDVKLRFAEAMLRFNNASQAAMSVIGDPGRALRAAQTLPADPLVIEEMARLRDEKGESSFLPSKAALAREVLEKVREYKNPEDYLNGMKLYCTMMGHIEKPGTQVNVDARTQSVMILRSHGDDEEWEKRAVAQQQKLTLNAVN